MAQGGQQNCAGGGVMSVGDSSLGVMKFYFEVGGGLSIVFDYVINFH